MICRPQTGFEPNADVQNFGCSLVAVFDKRGGGILENDSNLLAPGLSANKLDVVDSVEKPSSPGDRTPKATMGPS